MTEATLPLSDLLWLQRLATVLTRDRDAADDLVQATLVTAWTHPPRDTARPLRPWLGTVLRNLFRMERRASTRRSAREVESAGTDTTQSVPDAELARLEVLRVLLDELGRLPPEDRKILDRRFFRDESAAAIAEALAMPAATVRSRIHRTLQHLRGALDERLGGRTTWSAAVLAAPIGAAPPPTLPARPGVATTGLFTATFATVAVAGLCAMPTDDPPADPPPELAAAPRPAAPVITAPSPAPEAAWERRRQAIRRIVPAPAIAPQTPSPPPRDTRDFRALLTACIDDLDSRATGAVTLEVTEIGAPDIGRIYDSVELITTTFNDSETLECVTQSMHAWVGEPPDHEFARRFTLTFKLGETRDEDAAHQQAFDYIVGAHIGEVAFCQKLAPSVQGHLILTVTMGAGAGKAATAQVEATDVPDGVSTCIRDASLRWIFPDKLAGQTRQYRFTLPIHLPKPGPALGE